MLKIRFHIHLVLCLAIMSATISPACAFISGQGGDWIEICSGLDIQKIRTDNTSNAPDVTQSGCEFCFQFSKVIGIENDSFLIDVQSYPVLMNGFQDEIALVRYVSSKHARAPPYFS